MEKSVVMEAAMDSSSPCSSAPVAIHSDDQRNLSRNATRHSLACRLRNQCDTAHRSRLHNPAISNCSTTEPGKSQTGYLKGRDLTVKINPATPAKTIPFAGKGIPLLEPQPLVFPAVRSLAFSPAGTSAVPASATASACAPAVWIGAPNRATRCNCFIRPSCRGDSLFGSLLRQPSDSASALTG